MRRRTRTVVIAAATAGLLTAGAGTALGYWSLSASASGAAGAAVLQPPSSVTVTARSTTAADIVVTGVPTTGPTPTGYQVARGGVTVCAQVALNAVCSDTGLAPDSTVAYTVTSLLGSWRSGTVTDQTVDTPPVPSPGAPQLVAASDTGVTGDGLTTVTTPTFTGSAPAGTVVTLLVDGTAVAPTGTANAAGVWTIRPNVAPSANVVHAVRARTSQAGVPSAPSAALNLLIDTVRPTTGTATATCSTALVGGFCAGTTTITVTGLSDAAPSSGLSGLDYSIAGGASGTAPITGGTATVSVSAPDGTPTVTFRARDVAGNQATTAGTITPSVKLDRTAPTVSGPRLSSRLFGTVGQAERDDTLALDLSDATSAIDPASICTGFTSTGTDQSLTGNNVVTVTITDNGTNDLLTVSPCAGLGTVALGGNYVTSGTLVFRGSGSNTSLVGWDGRTGNTFGTLTVTLGGIASGTARSGASAGVPVLTATGMADRAGNVAAVPVSGSSSRF